MFRIAFLRQIFTDLCFCLQDFIKIVWQLLAAVSIIGLMFTILCRGFNAIIYQRGRPFVRGSPFNRTSWGVEG